MVRETSGRSDSDASFGELVAVDTTNSSPGPVEADRDDSRGAVLGDIREVRGSGGGEELPRPFVGELRLDRLLVHGSLSLPWTLRRRDAHVSGTSGIGSNSS